MLLGLAGETWPSHSRIMQLITNTFTRETAQELLLLFFVDERHT